MAPLRSLGDDGVGSGRQRGTRPGDVLHLHDRQQAGLVTARQLAADRRTRRDHGWPLGQDDVDELERPGRPGPGDDVHRERPVGGRATGADLARELVGQAADAADRAERARVRHRGGERGAGPFAHAGLNQRVLDAEAGGERGPHPVGW
jgi:hypothetical protein